MVEFECEVCFQHFQRRIDQGQRVCSRICQGKLRSYTHPIEARLVKNSRWEGDCLVWIGKRNKRGYGSIEVDGRTWRVHRYVWTVACGPIPEGYVVLHLCDNPSCLNLQHLAVGTQHDNVLDNLQKDRHSKLKVSREDVELIRQRVAAGESRKALAREYNLCSSTVSRYCSGKLRNV